jgi:FdhE protein
MARAAILDPRLEAIGKRLDRLAAQKPELAEPIAFYRAALPLLQAAQTDIEPFSLPAHVAQQKIDAGLPVLLGEALPLDPDATQALFIRLCQIMEEIGLPAAKKRNGWPFQFMRRDQSPDPAQLLEQAHAGNGAALRATAAGQIRRAVEQDQLDLMAIWSALAAGDLQMIDRAARELKVDSELLRTTAQNSLKPAFQVWAQGFKEKVDLDHWRRGPCPICGSRPTLSEIQGKENARHLRCGMCGADWYYPRLQCAFCHNRDHRRLGQLTVDGEAEKYNVQLCEVCRDYLKTVITFEPTPAELLPIEDLATLHLDMIAAERNYSH